MCSSIISCTAIQYTIDTRETTLHPYVCLVYYYRAVINGLTAVLESIDMFLLKSNLIRFTKFSALLILR